MGGQAESAQETAVGSPSEGPYRVLGPRAVQARESGQPAPAGSREKARPSAPGPLLTGAPPEVRSGPHAERVQRGAGDKLPGEAKRKA